MHFYACVYTLVRQVSSVRARTGSLLQLVLQVGRECWGFWTYVHHRQAIGGLLQ
jgi:hypothetical protein